MPLVTKGQTMLLPTTFSWLQIKVLSSTFLDKKRGGTTIVSITFDSEVLISGRFNGQIVTPDKEPSVDDWAQSVFFCQDGGNFSISPPEPPEQRNPGRLLMAVVSDPQEEDQDEEPLPTLSAANSLEDLLTIRFLGMNTEGLIYNLEHSLES